MFEKKYLKGVNGEGRSPWVATDPSENIRERPQSLKQTATNILGATLGSCPCLVALNESNYFSVTRNVNSGV